MSAWSRQAALLRHPWQARAAQTGWRSPWAGTAVVALCCAGLAWAWPARATLFAVLAALVALASHAWLGVDGLMRQNRPALARLLPGHTQALRVQLLVHLGLVALAAWAVLALAFGVNDPWLWRLLPAIVMLAWLPREPWMWLLVALGSVTLPWWAWAEAVAQAAPGLKLLLLLAAGALVASSVGQAGAWHCVQAARMERWRRAVVAQRQGRGTPPAAMGAMGALGRQATRLFDWPRRWWRRRLLAMGPKAPLHARLDLGLGFGGQWAELAWAAVLLFGAVAIALALNPRATAEHGLQGLADIARFGVGLGAYSMITSVLHGRLARLWARRREQALLALLPGLPAQDLGQLERSWLRGDLLAWLVATVCVLAVGAVGSPGSLDHAAACAAMCLPLPWLAQHLQRRLQGPPSVALLAVPVLAATLAGPVQFLGVPAWASLAAGALAAALLAQRRDPRALALPVGRSS